MYQRISGNIFVIGGTDESGCRLSSGEYFSPSVVDWREISPLRRPRTGSAVVACKGNKRVTATNFKAT